MEYKNNSNTSLHLQNEEKEIIIKKRKFLKPIIDMLTTFMNKNIYVHHSDKFDTHVPSFKPLEPQKFSFYLAPSSKSWFPGISICFDHPANVEIAVPNDLNDGKVIIRVATHHPDSYLLENQKYNSIDEAMKQILLFLKKNIDHVQSKQKKIPNVTKVEPTQNVKQPEKVNITISQEDPLFRKLELIFDLQETLEDQT